MIENQEIDYSKLSEILAETEEPAFFKCFFNGTALRSLKAENAVFNDCKMSNIDFSYSDFNGAVFRNCDLNNCNFNGCRLFDAKFENCKLSGSDFPIPAISTVNLSNVSYAIVLCPVLTSRS